MYNGRTAIVRLIMEMILMLISYISLSVSYCSKNTNTNCGSFLIKCLQILSNFAYIWGVSLRLSDLACPIEVGRPYLHLLADH